MDNLKTYEQMFKNTFAIGEEALKNNFQMEGNELWDSVGHITLITNLEDAFGITIDIDDMAEITSYEKGKEILKKYAVLF